jgi:hypothetical protein
MAFGDAGLYMAQWPSLFFVKGGFCAQRDQWFQTLQYDRVDKPLIP